MRCLVDNLARDIRAFLCEHHDRHREPAPLFQEPGEVDGVIYAPLAADTGELIYQHNGGPASSQDVAKELVVILYAVIWRLPDKLATGRDRHRRALLGIDALPAGKIAGLLGINHV